MKYRIAVPAIIVAVLLLLPCAFAQAPQLTPFSADTQFTPAHSSAGAQEMTGKIYVDHSTMRMDMQGGPAWSEPS